MFDEDVILKLKSGTEVKNARGTGDDEPVGGGSWKEFYEERRTWPKTCRIRRCSKDATAGAHVKIEGEYGEWIIPMCAEHNHPSNEDWMPVNQDTFAILEVEQYFRWTFCLRAVQFIQQ